jgi:hypothetical protein
MMLNTYQDKHLKIHLSIKIPWKLAAPPIKNLYMLPHVLLPCHAKSPTQIEEPHIRFGC